MDTAASMAARELKSPPTSASRPSGKLGYMGIMENKMETTIVYWGNIGIMEKKMETTIVYCLQGNPCLSLEIRLTMGWNGLGWDACSHF